MSAPKIDFSGTEKTIGGYTVKQVKFNSTMNVWTGLIYDETWASKWITCLWDRNGKIKNKQASSNYNLK